MKKLIGPFAEIITLNHLPMKGALSDDQLEIIREGGVVVQNDLILEIGSWQVLKKGFTGSIELIESDQVLLPGFIDAHTHICFAGNRAQDYAMRIAGKSYLEIAKSGGGIWDTVQKTRAASTEALINGILERAKVQLANGITTCEVKSGYGLSVDHELKMLRAIKSANENTPIQLISTCLAAHIKPKDFDGDNEEYLNYIAQELLPQVQEENLSNRVDIFIEESAFTKNESISYLSKAKAMGFELCVHGDQFTPIGSHVAVEMNALSVDHLEASTEHEIKLIANSNTIAMALPGASIGLGCPFTPVRSLLDQGAAVAIASDWNPGSAPMGDLLTQASILSTFEKLSTAETLAGITFRAASALKLSERGILRPWMRADFISFATKDHRDILYHQGQLRPSSIWKNGIREN